MKVDFKEKQSEFVAYIRDPFNNPRPGDVKRERIDAYRELLFNNVDSFLCSNFPVLKTILNDEQWYELSQDFFKNHACTTPYFSEISEEFLDFLQNQRKNNSDYPFLLELAHYEWVEMALSISNEPVVVNTEAQLADIFQHSISLSALAWPLVYQFPVQQISPTFLPEVAPEQPTYLLVYRNSEDEVKFIQISPITFRLLQILQENEAMSCQHCLNQIVAESGHPEPEKISNAGLQMIEDLARKQIIAVAQ
ncbi:MAG: putative DNA-binding domain-containing protein [Methylococcales bacterium]